MAYSDTLFQLGMDLTRSSPAQEEDSIDQVQALHGDRTDVGVSFHSSRLYINLSGAKSIGSGKQVERALGHALDFIKADVKLIDIRRADPRGWISGHAELADGHVTVDACPAKGIVAVDMVRRGSLRPDVAMTAFVDAFAAREVTLKKQRTDAELARMRPPVLLLAGAKPSGAAKRKMASSAKVVRDKAA